MPEKVYVFVRFGSAAVLEARNDFNRTRTTLEKVYRGKVIGFGEDVEILERDRGYWNGTHAIAILEFDSSYWAQQWFEGGDDIKQPDWLRGCDVLVVPVRDYAPPAKYIVLIDACIRDSQGFETYAQSAKEQLRSLNATPAVVATNHCRKLRGLWDPHYLVAHFLESRCDFDTLQAKADAKTIANKRRRAADCDVVGFEVKPL